MNNKNLSQLLILNIQNLATKFNSNSSSIRKNQFHKFSKKQTQKKDNFIGRSNKNIEMKATVRKQYKFYKLTAGYGEVKKSCIFFQYLFVMVHLLLAGFLMLLNISDQLKESVPFLGEAISNFQQNYMGKQIAYIFSYGQIGLNLLFILIVGIRLSLMPMYNQFNLYGKIQRYLFICTVLLGYVHQLTVYIIGWSIAFIYMEQGFFVFLGVGLLPIILYTHFNMKLDTTSLYKWFTIPLIILLTIMQSIFSYILIIAVSVYFIITEKMLFKRISFGLIILLSLFVLKHTLFNNTHPKQMLVSLISLLILTLLSSFLIFKLKNKSLVSNHNAQIQKSYNLLSQIKTNPFNQLKFKQFHTLYSTIMNFAILNKDNKNKQTQHILQTKPQKITKTDFLFLLQKYLDREIKRSTKNNFHKQIIRFKIRMELNHPISEMTQQLFLLNEEYLRSNKKNQNQFFQLLDQVINRYCVFNEGKLQTAFIFHMNQLHETFQERVIDLLDKIDQFWKNMTHQQIKRIEIDDSFDKIIKMKSDIQKLCKQMHKFGNFQRQRKVIAYLENLFNCYQEENKISTHQIKNILQSNEQEVHHSFLILENNLIKFISKDLLKNLGSKGNLSYENVDKKTLFGESFSSIVDDMIKNMNLETQKQWSTISILRKDGLIDLKKINIMWYPSLETKCRLMVRFSQDEDFRKEGYLIYEGKSDTIKYANQKFIVNFGICQERFLQKLRNQQMFFNELFTQGDISSEEVGRQLKEDTVIKCKMYVKYFVQKGGIGLVGVEIKVAKWIYMGNEPRYCILKVKKNDQKTKNVSRTRKNSQIIKPSQRQRTAAIGQQFFNTNQRSLSIKYEKQKFFCPIPNHYESKIIQKQAQLQQKNRWVWRYYIHLLVGVMFLTIIILWGLEYKFFSDRVISYKKERAAIQNTTEQYALLYQLYTIVTNKHYMRKYPEQVFLTNKTFQTVEVFYNGQQQTAIDQFLRRYLTQINEQPNKNIVYNLQFEFFNITSDSQRSTLLDFAQKFKRNLVNNDIDFLLKNYESFRNLTIEYENSFTYDQYIDQVVSSYSIYFYVLIVLTSLWICLIFYTLFKIQAGISVIYSLIQLLSIKQFEKNCNKFKAKKQKIINSLHRTVSHSNKMVQNSQIDYQSNPIGNNTNNTASTLLTVTEISHQQSHSILQAPSSNYFPSTSHFKDHVQETQPNQNQINQKKSLLTQDQIEIKKPQIKKRLIDEPILLKINRKLYFFLLLIGLNIVFVVDHYALMKQKDGIIQVFDIRRSLCVSLLHVKRIQTDAIIQPLIADYFNHSISTPYQTSKVDLVTDMSQQFILQQLQTFKEKSRTLLASDMCLVVGKSLTQNIKPCNSYLKGIVTKGFGQTFDIFQLNAKVLSSQSLYDFGPYLCTAQKCTPYYEHVYVSALMGEMVRSVTKILNSEIASLTTSQLKIKQTAIIYKMSALFILIIVYLFYNNSLSKRCKRSINYFRMIPKEMMCTMKVTTYMRKNQVLNEFDIL